MNNSRSYTNDNEGDDLKKNLMKNILKLILELFPFINFKNTYL